MSLVAFLAFFKYVFIMSYTPGPANLFSLNVGMHYGFKSFLKTYLGLVSGFFLVCMVSAAISYGFILLIPDFRTVASAVGGIYILWISWHVLRSKPIEEEDNLSEKVRIPGVRIGFLINISNVKVMFFCMSVIEMYFMKYCSSFSQLVLWCIPLVVLSSSSTFTWAIAGRALTGSYNRHYKIYNVIMAVLLFGCMVEMIVLGL